MGVYALGADAILLSQFHASPGGPAVDPPLVTLTVTRQGVELIDPATHPGEIVRTAPGHYRYIWTVPTTLEPGDCLASWSGQVLGQIQTGQEVLTVVAAGLVVAGDAPRSCWASVRDVAGLTGVVVTQQQLLQANAMVELRAGRTYLLSATRVGRGDTEWLRRAVAYQAAWLPGQPDAFQRMDLVQLSASGRGGTLTPTAIGLAPLARWALGRVSWLRSRSVHVRSPFLDGTGALSPSALAEVNDAVQDFAGFAGGVGSFGNDDW